jgi:hypothetical protein
MMGAVMSGATTRNIRRKKPHPSIFAASSSSKGTVFSDYFAGVSIGGPKPWAGAKFTDLYSSGTVVNIKEFYEAVTEGRFDNATAQRSVDSHLTAILGREAMLRKARLTMDELIKEGKTREVNLRGLKV